MLRTLQTRALSQKIATLFDTLVPATNKCAQPIPVEASHFAYRCEQPPRRRRTRRHRLVAAPGTLRTAWF